jgi:hypothetical protein
MTSAGSHLPTPELTSLSRSVSQCSSLPTSKYASCVTCKKALLGKSSGPIECKKCDSKTKEDLAIQAKLVQMEAENIRSRRSQARSVAKPLFQRKIYAKIRTEKIYSIPSFVHDRMISTPLMNSAGVPSLEGEIQANLPSPKRKHGETLRTVDTMYQTLIGVYMQSHRRIQSQL